ncbi:MazG-like family protein [Streptomyces parvus]|uniref:MazG-like family protein n=1 Tax=Streptomyces parvus TaxID=66428 RepID=UPI0033EF84FD
MDTLWDNIEKLSAVCRAAGAHFPDEELKALQVGKVAEEAGEAIHALHGLKGLTTCGDDHTWSEVQNDLVGSVIAALLAMHYIDPTGARATFDEILPAGRAGVARPLLRPDGLRTWPSTAPVGRGRRPCPAHKLRREPAPNAAELSLLHQDPRTPRARAASAARPASVSAPAGRARRHARAASGSDEAIRGSRTCLRRGRSDSGMEPG